MSKTNWKIYEKSSKNEEKVFLEIAKDKVWASEEPKKLKEIDKKKTTKQGRPRHNWRGMVVICLLMIFHRKTYREISAHVKINHWLVNYLELKKVPGKSAINDYFALLDKKWLEELNKSIIEEFKKEETFSNRLYRLRY